MLRRDPTAKLTTMTHSLKPGQTILLYTDGAIEETNPAGKQFGLEGLKRAFAQADDEPEPMLSCISQTIAAHRHGEQQADDKAMVAIQVNGDKKRKEHDGSSR